MDPLTDILAHLRFAGSLYFATEFTAPWGVAVPSHAHVIRFHLVMRGRCYARVSDRGEVVALKPGDFVLVPHGAAHQLLDRPETPATLLDEVLKESGFDGTGVLIYGMADRGEETRLICGHFSYDPLSRHPLLAELPELILVPGEVGATAPWLQASLALMSEEQATGRAGREAIILRLTEILFVHAIRSVIDTDRPARGILKALGDPRLARALAAIHHHPDRRWTVESLSREAMLSRTVFAERFHALAGQSPLRYVTNWRLERARYLLKESNRSLEEIAMSVGYRSTSAFGRVFRRHMGMGPGALRRRARQ